MTALYAACFGLAFGSFAAAAIERIAVGRALSGRSHCEACCKTLAVWELVPVLSYVALRGRCSSCRAPIGAQSALVEIVCGGAFAVASLTMTVPAAAVTSAMLVAALIAAGVLWKKRGLAP